MLSSEKIIQLLSQDSEKPNNVSSLLEKFYQSITSDEKLLVVVGGGTAALTYLYTEEIGPQYSHILIIGDRGYWGVAAHRLAQPHHIFALPHSASDEFIDPALHDKQNQIAPHQPESAYVHSHDYQTRLIELEKATLETLREQGKQVLIMAQERVTKIEQEQDDSFQLQTQNNLRITAHKVIIATGAGPSRTLPLELQEHIKEIPEALERVLNYTDVLSPIVDKCKDKAILIYGGGATAAWAMEVAALTAKPVAWVGRSGFELAIEAGPRVNAIIEQSRPVQISGVITSITYAINPETTEPNLLIKVLDTDNPEQPRAFWVDYLFNCIGQEPYELGGLPEMLSDGLKKELIPYLDKKYVTGDKLGSKLGWATPKENLMIIGAALGTYYDKDKELPFSPSVSTHLPRSGQVPITIAAVVSSICALTDYMPFRQDGTTGKTTVSSLNIHIMNANQLAVYFTACYPCAPSKQINRAISVFIQQRENTDFGLSAEQLSQFFNAHFGSMPDSEFCEVLVRPKKTSRVPTRAPQIMDLASSFSSRESHGFFKEQFKSLKREDTFAGVIANIPDVDENIELPCLSKQQEPIQDDSKQTIHQHTLTSI